MFIHDPCVVSNDEQKFYSFIYLNESKEQKTKKKNTEITKITTNSI